MTPLEPTPFETHPLAIYNAACRAIAEARSIYEAKEIRDQAVAMAVYARQAKNRDMEADAVALRMRATRRLAKLIEAQKETVGLSQGGRPTKTGLSDNPVLPTLAMQGVDKNLAHQARVLGALSDEEYEKTEADARAAVNRAVRTVVAEAELDQERAAAAARAEPAQVAGCTIDDLIALAASGYRADAILADVPWHFATWSHRGLAGDASQENRKPRSRDAPYKTMSHEDICKLPVEALAAKDCVLLLWVLRSHLPDAMEVIQRWGFEFKSVAFVWFKGEDQEDQEEIKVPIGTGIWTRAGTEQVWLATRGNPRRLHADVREVIIEPRREHSRKPDCVFERIERLVRGPHRLELFARPTSPGLTRPGWTVWGDEIPRDAMTPPAAAEPGPSASARPRVLNVSNLAGEQPGTGRVYVGHNLVDGVRVKWSNPFRVGVDGTREEVVAKYRAWVTANPALMAALPELAGKDLVCHCAPKSCHADILLELANAPAAAAAPGQELQDQPRARVVTPPIEEAPS
jgi:N6-adenosine-specific RNA methylase IME4